MVGTFILNIVPKLGDPSSQTPWDDRAVNSYTNQAQHNM